MASPEPTTTEGPTPTTSETENPHPTTAQAICEAIYRGRGTAPQADSGNVDDEMALFEAWHAGLIQDAITQLGSSAELKKLVATMEEMRTLSARAALIYAGHPVFSAELTQIQERQTALADEVGPIAANSGAPMCVAVVVLP